MINDYPNSHKTKKCQCLNRREQLAYIGKMFSEVISSFANVEGKIQTFSLRGVSPLLSNSNVCGLMIYLRE